jgi:hypothetical protein
MTTSTPENPPAPVKAKEPAPKKARVTFGTLITALVLFLLELILPVLVAGGLIWYLFATYNLWGLDRTMALILFGAAVVILALVLSVLLDSILTIFRNNLYRHGSRVGSGATTRMIKMALAGVVIPTALVIAANQAILPNNTIPMNLLIALAQKPLVSTPPAEIGSIAMKSENPATKILSIQVLEGFHSPEALAQLVQIAGSDTAALQDAGVSQALSKAIAAYGLSAKKSLLGIFAKVDPLQAGKASGVNSGLFQRYFSNSFDSLKAEITLEIADPADREARLARIQAAQAELSTAMRQVEETVPSASSSDPRPAFVLNTLLAMDITADKDLLAFAKDTAANTHYSSQVRGDALLLIAKLGDKTDLDGLFLYLKGGDDLLQSRCLQAIFTLQEKLSHTVGK